MTCPIDRQGIWSRSEPLRTRVHGALRLHSGGQDGLSPDKRLRFFFASCRMDLAWPGVGYAPHRSRKSKEKFDGRRQERAGQGDRGGALADRQAVRQGLDHAAGQPREGRRPRHPHRRALARRRPGRGRGAPRPRDRDLRPGIVRQDHPGPAHHRRGPAPRRHGRLHRRRARARRGLRGQARRRHRQPAGLPARQRRAGAGDRRDAHPLRRRRRHRHRLRGRPGAPHASSKARWATRRWACRPGS